MTADLSNTARLARWTPTHLPVAKRQFAMEARRRGLLVGGDSAEESGEEMEQRATRLRTALVGHGPVKLRRREWSQLAGVVAWLHHQSRQQKGAADTTISDLAEAGAEQRLSVPSRAWWALIVYGYDVPRTRRAIARALVKWPTDKLKRLPTILRPEALRDLAEIPAAFASAFVLRGGLIDDIQQHTGVPADSPLGRSILSHLLSEPATPWLAAHPISTLVAFLRKQEGNSAAGLLGRRLLEPPRLAGLTSHEVGEGSPFGQVVAMVYEGLGAKGSPAWRALGPSATEVIRWWRVQRQLHEFFETWHADPERKAFWLAYTPSISDVEHYKDATALAMKIGPAWFVEFGFTGNAAYAYSDLEWQNMAVRRQHARSPGDLKIAKPTELMSPHGRRVSRKKSHWVGWQDYNFPRWIAGWTGVQQ